MLRVTIKKDELIETWELEGRLSGEWVSELERCWKERASGTGTVQVLLNAVSYIDPAGKQLLAVMYAQGADIQGCGCLTRAVLEEIVKDAGIRQPVKKILALIFLGVSVFGGSMNLRAQEKSFVEPLAQHRPSNIVRNGQPAALRCHGLCQGRF